MKLKCLYTFAILIAANQLIAQTIPRLNVAGNLKTDTLTVGSIQKEGGTSSQILLANGGVASTDGLITDSPQTFLGAKTFDNQVRFNNGFEFGNFNGFRLLQTEDGRQLSISNATTSSTLQINDTEGIYVYNPSYPSDFIHQPPAIISQGNVQANKNVVAIDTVSAGLGIKLTNGKPSQMLLSNGTVTTDTARAGQVLTFQSAEEAPVWRSLHTTTLTDIVNSSIYTFSGTTGGTSSPNLTQRVNNLNLTLSNNSLTNWTAGAFYLVTISAKMSQTGNLPTVYQNGYFAISNSSSINSKVTYGNGASTSIHRSSLIPSTDYVSNSSTEIWAPTNATDTLYLTKYTDPGITHDWLGTVIIIRIK